MSTDEKEVDRVFVLGDIHGNVDFLRRAVTTAAEAGCRTILQLGDFGALSLGSRGFFRSIDETLHYAGNDKLVFIDGNHEGFTSDDVSFYGPGDSLLTGGLARAESAAERDEYGFRMLSEHVGWAPRGHRWTWNGVRFGALGGAFSVDSRWRVPGRSWWPDHEIPTDADVEWASGVLDLRDGVSFPSGPPIPSAE